MAMIERLFPRQIDNRFDGHRAALWLLGLFIALKLVMSFNSIFNTAAIVSGADGIALDKFDPAAVRTILMLFSLTALGQLSLTLIALTAVIRYRAMVPFLFVVLLGEQLVRRVIVQSYAVPRSEATPAGSYVTIAILVLLALGLLLSLLPPRRLPTSVTTGSPG